MAPGLTRQQEHRCDIRMRTRWYRGLAHLLGGSFAVSRSAGRGSAAQEKGAPPCISAQILMNKSRGAGLRAHEKGASHLSACRISPWQATQTHVAC